MPTKNNDSTKIFTRNKGRKVETVEFKLPEIFGDTAFEVPHFQHLQVKTLKALSEEGPTALDGFLRENGAVAEADAVLELELGEEFESFMAAWQGASEADFPKS